MSERDLPEIRVTKLSICFSEYRNDRKNSISAGVHPDKNSANSACMRSSQSGRLGPKLTTSSELVHEANEMNTVKMSGGNWILLIML